MQEKKHVEKSNTFKKYMGKIVDIFQHRIFCFFLQNGTINTIYYDYWDLITEFWLGSTKWNTPLEAQGHLAKEKLQIKFFKWICGCRGQVSFLLELSTN